MNAKHDIGRLLDEKVPGVFIYWLGSRPGLVTNIDEDQVSLKKLLDTIEAAVQSIRAQGPWSKRHYEKDA